MGQKPQDVVNYDVHWKPGSQSAPRRLGSTNEHIQMVVTFWPDVDPGHQSLSRGSHGRLPRCEFLAGESALTLVGYERLWSRSDQLRTLRSEILDLEDITDALDDFRIELELLHGTNPGTRAPKPHARPDDLRLT